MKLPQISLRDLFWLVLVAIACTSLTLGQDVPKLPLLEAEDLKLAIDREEPFDPSMLPEKLQQLEGKPVEIRGYMYPGSVFSPNRIERFVLTVETKGKPTVLGFGSAVPLDSCASVELKSGDSTKFTLRPVLVRGVLRIRSIANGDTKEVFVVLEDAEVKKMPPRPGFRNSVEPGC